jgi:cytochrome c biogenesis protein CcmG/thiol:disulfide interchange protein DsbE
MSHEFPLRIPLRWLLVAALALSALVVACGSDSSEAPAAGKVVGSGFSPVATEAKPGGDAAPSFVAETFSHGTYDLNARIGTPVVVNFWFPSCPPCRAEMPALQAAFEKYGDEVDFIGVQQSTLDSPESAKTFLEELGVTYPNFADETDSTRSDVQIAYKVLSFPTTVFLNRDHTIARTWTGLLTEEKLDEQITALIIG